MKSAVRHYLPVVVALAVLALIIGLAPSTVPKVLRASATKPVGPSLPAPDAPQSAGTAVSGVKCGPGVRQVTWSKYAPYCQPAYHGTNGGATAPGVTKTTITLTYREAVSPEEQALEAELGPDLLPSATVVIKMMNTYIKEFNSQYELYGRKVVLKSFVGKGDFLAEDDGTAQAAAQAGEDADTARSIGAFADNSGLAESPPYIKGLVANKIIALGGAFQSVTTIRGNAPYNYEADPDCQKVAAAGAQIIGRALAGKDAKYAGQATLRDKKRVFAVVSPNSQSYNTCNGILTKELKNKYGITLAKNIQYPLDLVAGTALAKNSVAQLKNAGVTTVICACDPITPIVIASDASAIDYHPEWFEINFGDAYNRLPTKKQWAHTMAAGYAPVPHSKDEAYQAFRLATPTGTLNPTYPIVYETLALFFAGLQAAGPDLTATNFERGLASLPPSLSGGMYGPWKYGASTVDAASGFEIMWWNPTGTDPQDGLKGTFLPCNDGHTYAYYGTPQYPLHSPLRCFGTSSASSAHAP